MSENEKKLIVITGASRGLGLAMSRACADAGYRVLGASRGESDAFRSLAAEFPGQLVFKPLDLGDTASHHAWAREVDTEFGAAYGLINNGALGHDGVLATMHESEITQLVTVNLTGTIILTKYLIRPMMVKREGRVLNVSSIIGSTGFSGLSVYGATKAGLLGFTRSLAREVGRLGITVNSLCPGYMETDMSAGIPDDKMKSIIRRSPLGELATVEDVSAAALYLLSSGGARVTGIDLTVDGGSSI